MTNIKELKKRFDQDSLSYRWGGIASDLSRLSAMLASRSEDRQSFDDVLTETKFFTEWLAPELDLKNQKKLLTLQRKLSEWSDSSVARTSIESEAKKWSRQILKLSGLI